MVDAVLGPRIRQRRREVGMTQADLARRVGISPSYLNLIEWNKRRIAGALLRELAGALDLTVDDLGGIAERRLQAALAEIAHLPALRAVGVEEDRSNELIGRFPGWAKAIAALAHSEREATARVRVLSDRLSNDPFLGESVHRMLTRVSAIRAASEILVEYPDATPAQRKRFNDIIHEEIRALSDLGEAFASYLEKAEKAERILTPVDEVEALFDACNNHFQEIEQASHDLAADLTDPQPLSRREKARARVEGRLGRVIGKIISDHPQVRTAAARDRARRMLSDYAVGAVLMPLDTFIRRAAGLKYDIEALAEAFSTEIPLVCHRLTALPRGEGVPRFGYLSANAAGTIIEMLGLEGLVLPRYAAACPLWALYRAQQSPEAVIRQRALFPTGDRFIFVARARNTGPTGFGKPRHYLTDMLTMTEEDARFTVYAPHSDAVVEEVGPSCRLCPRRSCAHRVEDPLSE